MKFKCAPGRPSIVETDLAMNFFDRTIFHTCISVRLQQVDNYAKLVTSHEAVLFIMATSTMNSQVESIDQIGKPPEGTILPPKDIRDIIEKTAGYVARNGPVFEERIREKERANPKFSFLTPYDAYNPFYNWRLQEVREGRGTDVSAGRVGEAKNVPEKPKEPTKPPDFHFSARMPNISAVDLDVVKLTALFVAKNGRGFITTLSQKQAGNSQFDFLRPQNSLHQYFSRLVDQYTDLIQAPTAEGGRLQRARMAELDANIKDRFRLLEKAKQRAEWVKYQEQQKQKKEVAEEKERNEYTQIEWHDFVIVETITFTDADEQADFPAPTSLNDLQSASLEQKAAMSLQPAHMRIEEAMPTADMAYYAGYNQNQYAMPPPAIPAYNNTSYMPSAQPMQAAAEYVNEDESAAIAQRAEERDKADAARVNAAQPMKIRNDYVPRAKAKRQNVAMGICPNCMLQIPVDEMDEHVRSRFNHLQFCVN